MDEIKVIKAAAVLPTGLSQSIEITIKAGLISDIATSDEVSDPSIDLSGSTLLPGFIDIHNHGAVGIDVNGADVDGLLAVGKFLAPHGVTAWVPTLVPDTDENYRKCINAIDQAMKLQAGTAMAQIVGVHYEGVFANERMCGALRPEYFKTFSGAEIDELPRLQSGAHMMTLAPEVRGGIELIAELNRRGWVVSIGHTHADRTTLDAAYGAGARHMTHFFNAMSGIHHRDMGVAGWGLAKKDVSFDIIADGVHVDPAMVQVACRAKSPEKVALISDSVAPTGLADGEFELWGEKLTVKNGRTQNERGSIAGSVATMADCVKVMSGLGFSHQDVAQMASTNPADLLGLQISRGSIAVGMRADLVAVDGTGNVTFAMIGGEIVDRT